jgi:hypothetical protein
VCSEVVEEASREGADRRFKPYESCSGAKKCTTYDLRRGQVAGWPVGSLHKKYFSYLFWAFLALARKSQCWRAN